MPPRKARQQPTQASGRTSIDWIQAIADGRSEAESGDPGDRARAAAEQRRVRLHDPRPDRRRHPADAGVPRRSRQRGRLRQLGRIAGDVAGPAEEVPGGGAARRRPPGPEARRASPSRRTRWSPTPTATSTASTGSSTSTSGSRPTTPTISWPPGGSAPRARWASRARRWRTSPTEAEAQPEVSGDGLGDARRRPATRSARSPRCRRCGELPPPDDARSRTRSAAGCERMRDFVVELRQQARCRRSRT